MEVLQAVLPFRDVNILMGDSIADWNHWIERGLEACERVSKGDGSYSSKNKEDGIGGTSGSIPDSVIPEAYHSFLVNSIRGLQSARVGKGSTSIGLISEVARQVPFYRLKQFACGWLCDYSCGAKRIEDCAPGCWSMVFAAKLFVLGSIVSYYYILPLYEDLYKYQHATRTHGWAHLGCGIIYFQEIGESTMWYYHWSKWGWAPFLHCAGLALGHAVHAWRTILVCQWGLTKWATTGCAAEYRGILGNKTTVWLITLSGAPYSDSTEVEEYLVRWGASSRLW